MTLPLSIQTRLEKVAHDTGFDTQKGLVGEWLRFSSSQAPLEIWLGASGPTLIVALSLSDVAAALGEHGVSTAVPLPTGAVAARSVPDVLALHGLLRRAFQLSRSLPDEPLVEFRKQTATMPRTTEVERLQIMRVGQDIFRARLMEYWDGRCAVTGLGVSELLRASHIKPWSECPDEERLDVFNGLLLAPNLDALFDKGFVTFTDDGTFVTSPALSSEAREQLGLDTQLKVRKLDLGHRKYLAWHRERLFRRVAPDARGGAS